MAHLCEHVAQQALCQREDYAQVDIEKWQGVNVLEEAEVVVG